MDHISLHGNLCIDDELNFTQSIALFGFNDGCMVSQCRIHIHNITSLLRIKDAPHPVVTASQNTLAHNVEGAIRRQFH